MSPLLVALLLAGLMVLPFVRESRVSCRHTVLQTQCGPWGSDLPGQGSPAGSPAAPESGGAEGVPGAEAGPSGVAEPDGAPGAAPTGAGDR